MSWQAMARRLGSRGAGRTRFPSVNALSEFLHGQGQISPLPLGPLSEYLCHLAQPRRGKGANNGLEHMQQDASTESEPSFNHLIGSSRQRGGNSNPEVHLPNGTKSRLGACAI